MKKAFTLTEVLIVLVIIGVITAILIPVAFQAAPDENVVKFKKANNTFATVIRELVSSDRYYTSGDLGRRANNTSEGEVLTAIDKNYQYFCETFAEILTYKSKNCSKSAGTNGYIEVSSLSEGTTYKTVAQAKPLLDQYCAAATAIGAEIVTSDNVAWYQVSPQDTFGKYKEGSSRLFSNPEMTPTYADENGFDRVYKVFCIDVDGIGKGEAPFGYGVRADGKILTGTRADEWMQKSVQKNDN